MGKAMSVSVLVPARGERFLQETVNDLLQKAAGEIEVIVNLDGYKPEAVVEDKRVTYLYQAIPIGMRAGINACAAIAKGEYLMKVDAHCMFEPGYDLKLAAEFDDNWIVIPRRYRLDAVTWTRRHFAPLDYHYLICPWSQKEFTMQNTIWQARDRARASVLLDDTMTFQGSCWFMTAEHFHKRLGGLELKHYWGWEQEPQELGNKTWLGGGRVVVNKNVWYAHLHKGALWGRMYPMNWTQVMEGHRYSTIYWLRNSWPGQIHPFSWLVEKFWPIPTWMEGWQEMEIPEI
jgi:glycosyltransferase involved in cell wall biosynthesis